MFDYKTIVSDDALMMEFALDSISNEDKKLYDATQEGEFIGQVRVSGATFEADSDEIFTQYKLWQTRPERKIGKQVVLEDKNLEELATEYEELLVGAYIMNRPEEKVRPDGTNGFCKMLDWLRTTDFYTCPASSIYHESFPGGLLIHTLKVYNKAMSILSLPEFSPIDPASATLVVLTHDWCKIGLYESYEKNVKNEKTGEWEKKPAYKRNYRGIPLGHGTTSMFLASKFFRLSAEEACAIRWHMGRWNVCDGEINEFQLANEKYPLVHLVQFADQLSITSYANGVNK